MSELVTAAAPKLALSSRDWRLLAPAARADRGLTGFIQRASFSHGFATVTATLTVALALLALRVHPESAAVIASACLPAYALGFLVSPVARRWLEQQPWGAHGVLGTRLVTLLACLVAVLHLAMMMAVAVFWSLLALAVFVVCAGALGGPAGGYLAGRIGGQVVGRCIRWIQQLLFGRAQAEENDSAETHGSAHFAVRGEVEEHGLYAPEGLLLGSAHGDPVHWNADGHLLTVAPSGSGKGVTTVIPNLLSHLGSVLVIDPKGENYAVTARARQTMGQRVLRLDPFELMGAEGDKLNPLDLLDPSSVDVADDAHGIADMLVVTPPDSKDPHWDEKAKSILRTLILYVATVPPPEIRNLATVRSLLFLDAKELEPHLNKMRESSVAGGVLQRGAAEIRNMPPEERASVMSVAQRHTLFLDSPRAADVLSRSTFDISELKAAQGVSLYLILPADKLGTHASLLRLWINMAVQAMVRSRAQPRHRVLFMLDEMAQLGPMDILLRAVTLMRSYHMTLWMIVQDLGQLKGLYPKKWETLLSNARVQQYFGVTDKATAEYVSGMLGTSTVLAHTLSSNETWGTSSGYGFGVSDAGVNSSFNDGDSSSVSQGHSVTEVARPLMTPDEVRRLPKNCAVLFIQGVPPVPIVLNDYRTTPQLAGRFDSNPMHQQ